MSMLSSAASWLGLSPLRLLIYAAIAAAALTAWGVYRQSLINSGWDNALEAVKKQDTTAKEAAGRAQRTVDDCYNANGTWSVITGSCTLGAKP